MNDKGVARSIALLIWNKEKEDDAHVFLGELEERAEATYFINKAKGWSMRLEPDVLKGMREVPDELKDIFLQADFSITVYISDLPDNEKAGFIDTGMNWGE
jgi:hypothetical protein